MQVDAIVSPGSTTYDVNGACAGSTPSRDSGVEQANPAGAVDDVNGRADFDDDDVNGRADFDDDSASSNSDAHQPAGAAQQRPPEPVSAPVKPATSAEPVVAASPEDSVV